jgi:putative transposase
MDDRRAMTAIFYVLRTGIQWKALPREMGPASTVHDRFQFWREQGVFQRMWEAGLQAYDEAQGIEWTWQAVDGAMIKAPLGEKEPVVTRRIAARAERSGACGRMDAVCRWVSR